MSDRSERDPIHVAAWAFLAAWYADGGIAPADSCDAAVALLDALTPTLTDAERLDIIDQWERDRWVPLPEEAQP